LNRDAAILHQSVCVLNDNVLEDAQEVERPLPPQKTLQAGVVLPLLRLRLTAVFILELGRNGETYRTQST
jgi:hypothetical protein